MHQQTPFITNALPYKVKFIKGRKHIEIEITNTQGPGWVDKQKIQELFHISDRTLHTLRKTKKIPFSRIGGKIFYCLPAILLMLEQDIVTP